MSNTNFKNVIILALALISLLFYIFYLAGEKSYFQRPSVDPEQLKAAGLMAEAEKLIFGCQQEKGLQPEKNIFDPNRTGLIGLEASPLTTTLGNLEAKRTTTNPNLAALLVYLLKKAGVKRGEVVAVGASSSFPALILAVYAAGQAMGVELLVINSLGASQWGANQPEFCWLDIEECLRQTQRSAHHLLAISWGGEDDSGKEFPEYFKKRIEQKASEWKLPVLNPGPLETTVKERMQLYFRAAGKRRISAFINIGGSRANLGTDSSILQLQPGLTEIRKIPPVSRRGVIQEMARRGIPVIHLLNISGLVQRYKLPWDPQPLPQPGENLGWENYYLEKKNLLLLFVIFVFASIIASAGLLLIHKKRGQREPERGL